MSFPHPPQANPAVTCLSLLLLLAGLLTVPAATAQDFHDVTCEAFWEPPPWGKLTAVAFSGDVALFGVDNPHRGLFSYDVSDPASPVKLDYLAMPSEEYVTEIAVYGDRAYVSCEDFGVHIVDISDPHHLAFTGQIPSYYTSFGHARAMTFADGLGYFPDNNYAVRIFDMADPDNPAEIGQWSGYPSARQVLFAGGLIYVANYGEGLDILAVTGDPLAPYHLGTYDNPGYMVDDQYYPADFVVTVAVRDGVAYLGDENLGLRILDVSLPSAPAELSLLPDIAAKELVLFGDLAYVGGWYGGDADGFFIIDITDPAAPVQVYHDPDREYCKGLVLRDNLLYYVSGSGYDIPPMSAAVLDLATPTLPTEIYRYNTYYSPSDVAWYDESLLGLLDSRRGLVMLDVTPGQTVAEAAMAPPVYRGICLVFHGDLAFVGTGLGWLQLLDMTDPLHPVELSLTHIGGDVMDMHFTGSHVCVAADAAGLLVVDISDPHSPVVVGTYNEDIRGFTGVACEGNHAYVADGWNGLKVLDISDPTTPVLVNQQTTTDPAYGVEIVDGRLFVAEQSTYVYTAGFSYWSLDSAPLLSQIGQTNTSGKTYDVNACGDYAYIADGMHGMQVYDVTTASPDLVGWYDGSESPEFDEGLYDIDILGVRVAATVGYERDGVRIYHYDPLVSGVPQAADSRWRLDAPRPNPFNPSTSISFELPHSTRARLTVYDLKGREVAVLVDGEVDGGQRTVSWDGLDAHGRQVPSGSYLVSLEGAGRVLTRKVVLAR